MAANDAQADPPQLLPDIRSENLTDLLSSEDNDLKAAMRRILDGLAADPDAVLSAFANAAV